MTIIIIYIACNQGGKGGGLRQLATAKRAGYAKPGRQGSRVAPNQPLGPAQAAAVVIAKSLPQGDDAMW